MRTIRRSSPYDNLTDAIRAFLGRRAAELLGLGLLALAGAVVAALATWSVEDPSLNNATDAAVRNLLGLPGNRLGLLDFSEAICERLMSLKR